MLKALAALVVAGAGKSTIVGALREAAGDETKRPGTVAKSPCQPFLAGRRARASVQSAHMN